MEKQYRVIEIIDEYSLLINFGRKKGADEGNLVRIISVGPEIIDPITNESLGTFDKVKAELTIVTAYELFSLCKRIKRTERSAFMNPLDQFKVVTEESVKIKVDRSSLSDKKLPDDDIIKIGDFVDVV